MKFIGYARVSTKDQAKKGSYEIQVDNIKSFCQEHSWELEKIFIDKGKHGWDLGSNEFTEMLEKLESVDGLVIEHNDRFFRGDPTDPTSMVDALVLYKEIFKKGKKVFSISDGELKMNTLMDVLILTVKTYESSNFIITYKKKQKDGIRKAKKEKGRWGRLHKEINLKQYKELRELGVSKSDCCKIFDISKPTLNKILRKNNIDDFGEFKTA